MTHRIVRTVGFHQTFSWMLTLVAMVALSSALAHAQVEGPKQTKRLVKQAGRTADSIMDSKNQIRVTVAAYNAILKEGVEDRRKAYKSLVKAIEKSDKSVVKIRSRGVDLNAEANQYFADWGKSVESIADEDLQQRGRARLDESRQRFTEILEMGRTAGTDFEVFMTALRDQVLYLGHDLNPAGVASVGEDATKLNQQAKDLFAKIDKTIMAYRGYASDLRPE